MEKKQGCGVAVKEIIQYLRIRESRCLQNALKWYETKCFSPKPPSFEGPQSAAPKPLPRLLLDPSYGPDLGPRTRCFIHNKNQRDSSVCHMRGFY